MMAILRRDVPKRVEDVFAKVRHLIDAREGVAAVEFALVIPIVAFIYLMAFQMTVAYSVANNATRAAAAVSDIVSQQPTTDTATLDDMYSLSKAIMAPYAVSDFKVKLTGITIDAGSNPTIAWSWQNGGTAPYQAGDPVTVPSELKKPGAFLVHAEVEGAFNYLAFGPNLMSVDNATIDIMREFYFRQRVGAGVACLDCPT